MSQSVIAVTSIAAAAASRPASAPSLPSRAVVRAKSSFKGEAVNPAGAFSPARSLTLRQSRRVLAMADEVPVDKVDVGGADLEKLLAGFGPAVQNFAPAGTLTAPAARVDDVTPEVIEEEQEAGPYRFLIRALGAAAVGAAGVALYKTVKSKNEEAKAEGKEDSSVFYTVQPGDSLSAIAKKYNTSVDVLKEANGITDASLIQPGQELWVPSTYVIQKGDTLSKLARQYNTTVDELVEKNGIRNPDLIFAGDILVIA